MKLTEEQAHNLVTGNDPEYELITDIGHGDIYKNYQTVTTVLKDSKGNTFGINWRQYTNHYGDGDDLFFDCELKPIICIEVTKKELVYQ